MGRPCCSTGSTPVWHPNWLPTTSREAALGTLVAVREAPACLICAREALSTLSLLPLPHLQADGTIRRSVAVGTRWESKPRPSRPRLADARSFVLPGTASYARTAAHCCRVVRSGGQPLPMSLGARRQKVSAPRGLPEPNGPNAGRSSPECNRHAPASRATPLPHPETTVRCFTGKPDNISFYR